MKCLLSESLTINSPFYFGQILLKTNKRVNSSAGHRDRRTVELESAGDVSLSGSWKGSAAWSLCHPGYR